MSELPDGIVPADPAVPRRSASGIVLRRGAGGRWEPLLGQRSSAMRFLPNFLVFPGGAVDEEDRPTERGAHARCASRELSEESGLEIPPGDWLDAGERITPAVFPVRFRTRYFVAELPAGQRLPGRPPRPAEIVDLRFALPETVLDEWADGRSRVPPPVLSILRALSAAPEAPLPELAKRFAVANREEERAPRIELVPDLWAFPVRTRTLPPASHTNVWMPGMRRFAIVDPGSDEEDEIRSLLAVVERRRSLGADPAAIVLTHHHGDHVGGVREVARSLELPVLGHPWTLDRLGLVGSGVEARPVGGGDRLDLGGVELVAHHTPGHAPGHLALEVVGRGELIAGDLLSGLSTILIDPEDGEMGNYLASLERMNALGCDLLFPAHGPPLPGAALTKLIEHRSVREQAVLARVGLEPTGVEAIARAAYADLPQAPVELTRRQTLSHLLFLEHRGHVARVDDGGRTWRRAGPTPGGGDQAGSQAFP